MNKLTNLFRGRATRRASGEPNARRAATRMMIGAEALEERRLFAVTGKPEPLNNGGVTYTGGIILPAPTPTPTPTPTSPAPTASPTPTVTPAATPSATAAATVPATDDDDQILEARSLSLNTPRTGSQVSYDTDVDMYKINLTAGDIIGFDLDNVAGFSTFDGRLRLFDGTGGQISTSNNDAGPNEATTLEPFIQFDVLISGTYYIGVSGATNNSYDAISGGSDTPSSFGPYVLTAQRLGYTNDKDDQIGEAVGIPNGDSSRDSSITAITDVDFFRLNARAGQRFIIEVRARNSSGLDSALQIFDASGNLIAADTGGNTLIDFVAPLAGNYYLGVSANPNTGYDPFLGDFANDAFGNGIGDYRLVVDKR